MFWSAAYEVGWCSVPLAASLTHRYHAQCSGEGNNNNNNNNSGVYDLLGSPAT